MGYRSLNRLDEPVFIAVSKPLLTEFDIDHRLESCGTLSNPHTPFVPCAGLKAETSPDGLYRHAPLSTTVRNQRHLLLLNQFLPGRRDQLLS